MADPQKEAAAVWVDIERLKPWADNPRRNDPAVARVAESIKRFGFGAPVVARLADSQVIAGHTRLKAAVKLGLPKVPVRFLDLDPVDARLLSLADNKIGELADWDDEALARILRELRDQDVDLTVGVGFSDAELRALLEEPVPPGGAGSGAELDDAPAATEALLAKWGVASDQLWVVDGARGAHRILCGDCRRAADVARLLDGRKANVAFTSPPYASQREYDEASDFRPVPADAYVDWFDLVQAQVREHLTDDGSWFVNIRAHCEGGERHLYVYDLVVAHARQWGWRFIDDLCWVRAGVPGSWPNRFKNGWEPVFHFATQAQIKFRPDAVSHPSEHAFDYSPANGKSASGSGLLGKEHASGFREGLARPSNVVEVGSGGTKVSGAHPAEFPVGLPEFFIKAFSDDGDAVYEPFAGSGTTILAAEAAGRVGYGIEISPKYVAVILERLASRGLKPKRA